VSQLVRLGSRKASMAARALLKQLQVQFYSYKSLTLPRQDDDPLCVMSLMLNRQSSLGPARHRLQDIPHVWTAACDGRRCQRSR
jgi:hypothetical protein